MAAPIDTRGTGVRLIYEADQAATASLEPSPGPTESVAGHTRDLYRATSGSFTGMAPMGAPFAPGPAMRTPRGLQGVRLGAQPVQFEAQSEEAPSALGRFENALRDAGRRPDAREVQELETLVAAIPEDEFDSWFRERLGQLGSGLGNGEKRTLARELLVARGLAPDPARNEALFEAVFEWQSGIRFRDRSLIDRASDGVTLREMGAFNTPEAAVLAALDRFNPDSIRTDNEIGATIIERNGQYFIQAPNVGPREVRVGRDKGQPPTIEFEANPRTVVAAWHTHGNADSSGLDELSDADRRVSEVLSDAVRREVRSGRAWNGPVDRRGRAVVPIYASNSSGEVWVYPDPSNLRDDTQLTATVRTSE